MTLKTAEERRVRGGYWGSVETSEQSVKHALNALADCDAPLRIDGHDSHDGTWTLEWTQLFPARQTRRLIHTRYFDRYITIVREAMRIEGLKRSPKLNPAREVTRVTLSRKRV